MTENRTANDPFGILIARVAEDSAFDDKYDLTTFGETRRNRSVVLSEDIKQYALT